MQSYGRRDLRRFRHFAHLIAVFRYNEGHFTGGKGLSDADGRDQRQRNQHIRLDVKGRDQANDRFQNDGQTAQKDREPCQIKGERLELQQVAKNGSAGDHEQDNILPDPAKRQKLLQLFHNSFHRYLPLYRIGYMHIVHIGVLVIKRKIKKSVLRD